MQRKRNDYRQIYNVIQQHNQTKGETLIDYD